MSNFRVQTSGVVVVLGDFNAHLGSLAGSRGQGDPKTQGIFVEEVLKEM